VKPKRVLITGGAGFIGARLSHALLGRGYRVRILDSLIPQVHGEERRFPAHLDARIERIRGDVCDRAAVDRALQGVDVVYHLAALTGVGQSMYQVDAYTRVNVGGTSTLLQALVDRNEKLERFVLASSRAVYGEGRYLCETCGPVYPASRLPAQLDARQWDLACPTCESEIRPQRTDEETPCSPASVYAITKRTQEDLTQCVGQAYGIPTVVLRFFNVYGAGQAPSNPYTGLIITFLSRLVRGEALELYEDGQMQRDFVHVRDVVAACLAAAERPEAVGQCINVGTGERITVEQLAQTLIQLTRAPVEGRPTPVARVGDVRHVVADIRRARTLLGYSPSVSLREGLSELVDWFRSQDDQADRTVEARIELQERSLLRRG
jgi:dTDP-L-rhamnose 4-epimerase